MLEEINIENLIYKIRGKQVMFDSDLAKLYGCKNGTKDINKAVNRNIEKFPEDFYFQLNEREVNLWFQNGTAKVSNKSRSLPHVFTEQGIAMLATVLRTENVSNVSIKIMRTFVAMRKFINENKDVFRRMSMVEYEIIECKDKISELFDKFETKKFENQKIFFNGQIYDAYSLIVDLIKEAEVRIIIIDNYIDKSILDMLVYKKENVDVLLVTSSHYLTNLTIKYSNIFHDRFIVIDNTLYHVGASFKDLGKKCFGINKIEDKDYLNKIIEISNI